MESSPWPSHPPQICLSASEKSGVLVSPANASFEDRKYTEEIYLSVVFQYTSGLAHLPYELRYMNPHPVMVSRQFLDDLEQFHHALTIALNHIVQRWCLDKEAAFAKRMPLEPHEEELLQWVSQQSESNVMHSYEGHQGNWRPDLLLPADKKEAFQMCEINARYPFNSIDLAALFYKALSNPDIKPPFLDIPADADRLLNAIFAMFNPCLPIHFLQSRSFIATRKNVMAAFLNFAERRTGMRPRVVSPEQMRLVPDSTSRTGHALYCNTAVPGSASSADRDGDNLEKIHQVGLQLTVNEYEPLKPEIRHHLALCGVNDVRSMLLVQDKRILGIIHQELDALVTTHRVLTAEQADLLRRRVIPTVIPGSEELQQLIDSYQRGTISKDKFILKPVRGSRGAGILFGDELDNSEWEAILIDLQDPEIGPDRTPYVIQPVVTQSEEELFLDEETGMQRCQRVGAYHAVNGEFVGLGAWRAVVSSQRTCNMATGQAWKLGSMVMQDG